MGNEAFSFSSEDHHRPIVTSPEPWGITVGEGQLVLSPSVT